MNRFIVAVFIACLGIATAQVSPAFESNAACLERFEIPSYPPIARQARIEGTITATLRVSSNGSAETIATDFASQLSGSKMAVSPTVEKAIREARFLPECTGKTVTLIFDFKIAGPPTNSPRQSISFGAPNRFWIVSEPQSPQP